MAFGEWWDDVASALPALAQTATQVITAVTAKPTTATQTVVTPTLQYNQATGQYYNPTTGQYVGGASSFSSFVAQNQTLLLAAAAAGVLFLALGRKRRS